MTVPVGSRHYKKLNSLFTMLVISEHLCEGSLKAESSVLLYLRVVTISGSFSPT